MMIELDDSKRHMDAQEEYSQGALGDGESMASLLDEQTEFLSRLEKGQVVWVKVAQIISDQVLVDIGEKSEAVVPTAEFAQGEIPVAGRKIPVVLVKRGFGEKSTLLSTAKARWRLGWEQVVKAFSEKARVRGKVTSAVKGGFLVDVGGVTGFMPASLADLRPVRKPQTLIGTGVRCLISELNKEKGQLILSRKAVLEEEAHKRKTQILSELQEGASRIGRVTRVSPAGAFMDVGGLEGLVHTEDVAWKEPEKAKAKLERGAKIRVKVIKIERETQRVSLGIKQLLPHPGDVLRKKYPIKSVVRGKVAEILPEGVRIDISATDAAFCPVTELRVEGLETGREKWDKGPDLPPVWPKVGDSVSGIVMGVRMSSFDVGISIRRFEAIQDRKQVARYLKGAPPLTLGQVLNPEGE